MADSNVLMPADYLRGAVRRPGRPTPESFHRRRSAAVRRASGRNSNAPFSTPTRRAGSASPTTSAWASRRARPCSIAATSSRRPAASALLERELAEDAASTKIVRRQGLRVRVVNRPFAQPLGRRTAARGVAAANPLGAAAARHVRAVLPAGDCFPAMHPAARCLDDRRPATNDWPCRSLCRHSSRSGTAPKRRSPRRPAGNCPGARRSHG